MNDAGSLTVTLTAVGNGPPAAVRFRRALKALLRSHGLRASWPAGDVDRPMRSNASRVAGSKRRGRRMPEHLPNEGSINKGRRSEVVAPGGGSPEKNGPPPTDRPPVSHVFREQDSHGGIPRTVPLGRQGGRDAREGRLMPRGRPRVAAATNGPQDASQRLFEGVLPPVHEPRG